MLLQLNKLSPRSYHCADLKDNAMYLTVSLLKSIASIFQQGKIEIAMCIACYLDCSLKSSLDLVLARLFHSMPCSCSVIFLSKIAN